MKAPCGVPAQLVANFKASGKPAGQRLQARQGEASDVPVGLMGRGGGRGLVFSAVRSAQVDDLAVDDRDVRGERHRRAVLDCRTRGRDAAIVQIVLSGIRTTPQRPPLSAFAAGFSGLALARRWRRGR